MRLSYAAIVMLEQLAADHRNGSSIVCWRVDQSALRMRRI